MKLGIVSRIDIPEVGNVVEEIVRIVGERAALEPVMLDKFRVKDLIASDNQAELSTSPVEEMDVDIILTIGGDGTILRTLRRTGIPLLPVNMGKVGFLAEVEVDELEESLEKLFAGDYHEDVRKKLMIKVNGERVTDAMNEAVMNTAQIAKMKQFRILVGDLEADRLRCDGLIVATPTGSTCYSMSAGAPILDPRASVNVIVPLAPFRLSSRPIVVPSDSEIEVETLDNKSTLLVVDGVRERELDSRDIVTFRKSENEARFIRFQKNFYRQVWRKLTV